MTTLSEKTLSETTLSGTTSPGPLGSVPRPTIEHVGSCEALEAGLDALYVGAGVVLYCLLTARDDSEIDTYLGALGPSPVSYTHLDVYKRQTYDRVTSPSPPSPPRSPYPTPAPPRAAPVSRRSPGRAKVPPAAPVLRRRTPTSASPADPHGKSPPPVGSTTAPSTPPCPCLLYTSRCV